MTNSNSQQQSHFQAIIVRAKNEHCSRDILLSSFITLNQLSSHLLAAFDINQHLVDYHQFSRHDENLEIETCFGPIGDQQQELEGFLTPIVPGVYIEHSHPHEPLPLFSIYKTKVQPEQDVNMSFRLLRDERYVKLDSCGHQLFYEFQYLQRLHYGIQLELKSLNLPRQFAEAIMASPKIIRRQGHLFTRARLMKLSSMSSCTKTSFLGILQLKSPTTSTVLPSASRNNIFLKSAAALDEQDIQEACRNEIERLKEERRLFLMNQQKQKLQHKKCRWIEPSGDHCAYCTLL